MSQTSRLSLLAGAAVACVSGTALAEGQAWSNADEVRALVSEVMADAETRSSLLQSGGTAGHDGNHFFLASSDGAFRLEVSGQIQFRYYLNFRDDDDNNGDGVREDDFESGFQTRRTKLFFEGTIFDPNMFYRLNGEFNFDGGDFELEDAYAGYRWDNGFSFLWGQFKLPFMREELVSEAYQLAADTSLVNSVFSQERSQGLQVGYSQEDYRVMVSFNDGFDSANSDLGAPRGFQVNGLTGVTAGYLDGGESDWGITGRAEIKFAGDWAQFQDFTSLPGSDFGVMLGVAGHIEGGDPQAGASVFLPTGDNYLYGAWTLDLSLEGDGWNFYVAGVGAHPNYDGIDVDGAGALPVSQLDFNEYGVVAQGGIFIPNTDLEPFVRYDVIFVDDEVRNVGAGSQDTFSTLTFGANYYLYGHASKFTFDVQWFIDDVGNNILAGNRDTSIGYLTDDDDNEITIRLQWQLLF